MTEPGSGEPTINPPHRRTPKYTCAETGASRSAGHTYVNELPPELLNNDPDGFAWAVWHQRTPRLVSEIRDAHPYGTAQRQALDDLLAEIDGGLIAPLGSGVGPGAGDREAWAAWGADYFGTPWRDAPFLWSESYFYLRLLDAVSYFGPGAWQGIDPFGYLKSAELRDPALGPDLALLDDLEQLPVRERGQAKVLASLWGNRADLGFRIGRSWGTAEPGSTRLVADQSVDFWAALGPDARVVLVADNAGREMLADLVLIDHLLASGQAASVALHVKPGPYYVSDATTADVLACLQRLDEAAGRAAQIAGRLHAALRGGQLSLETHAFYCAPWSYHRMPAGLAARFRRASLTIAKGDLNYRRLTGDRAWPATTPLASVTAYFPGRVAALRTLKSDVVTGLAPAVVGGLDAAGPAWRTDGQHALLQVRA
jgi:Damage-control phosphatase ARMT1-like domain